MAKKIGSVYSNDAKATAVVQDPVFPPPISQTYYKDLWFGSSQSDLPITVKFDNPMYSVSFRTQYDYDGRQAITGPGGKLIDANNVYMEAYSADGTYLGKSIAIDSALATDMAFYFRWNGKQNVQLEGQGAVPVNSPLGSVKIICPANYRACYIYQNGTSLFAYEATQQKIAEEAAYRAELKAAEDAEADKLRESLRGKFTDQALDRAGLQQLKKYQAQWELENSPEFAKLTGEEREKAFFEGIDKINAKLDQELIEYRKATGPNELSNPAYQPNSSSGSGIGAVGSGIGTGIPGQGNTSSGVSSLIGAFQNIYNPNEPNLQSLQSKFAGAIEGYVVERTQLLNSSNSALVSELRLIRLLLEKIIGA